MPVSVVVVPIKQPLRLPEVRVLRGGVERGEKKKERVRTRIHDPQ